MAQYGADTVRAYLMFLGPWDQGAPWSYSGIDGQFRFLGRVWNLVVGEAQVEGPGGVTETDVRRAVHHAIKEVTEDFEAFRFNTAIAELMTLQGALQRARVAGLGGSAEWRAGVETLLVLLAPIAPHITEELWRRLGHAESVHLQPWPNHDPAALVADTVTLAVQVNGKLRGRVDVAADADAATVLAAVKAEPNVARHLEGMTVVREVVVPGRLVNLVVKG